jgi:hypothetical protein
LCEDQKKRIKRIVLSFQNLFHFKNHSAACSSEVSVASVEVASEVGADFLAPPLLRRVVLF